MYPYVSIIHVPVLALGIVLDNMFERMTRKSNESSIQHKYDKIIDRWNKINMFNAPTHKTPRLMTTTAECPVLAKVPYPAGLMPWCEFNNTLDRKKVGSETSCWWRWIVLVACVGCMCWLHWSCGSYWWGCNVIVCIAWVALVAWIVKNRFGNVSQTPQRKLQNKYRVLG